jgi:hypothetical protein
MQEIQWRKGKKSDDIEAAIEQQFISSYSIQHDKSDNKSSSVIKENKGNDNEGNRNY